MDKLRFKKTHIPWDRHQDLLDNPAYRAFAALDTERRKHAEWLTWLTNFEDFVRFSISMLLSGLVSAYSLSLGLAVSYIGYLAVRIIL